MRKKRRRTNNTLRRNNFTRVHNPRRGSKAATQAGARKKKVSMKPGKLAKELANSVQPKFWRKHAKLFWFLVCASLGVAAYIFVFYSRFFLVDEILVVRHDLTIDRSAVESRIGYIYGENIFTIDVERLQKNLADDFPALAYANIKKIYPRAIEIEVDSFEDALIAQDPLGVNYNVNEVGMITGIGVQEFNLPIIKFIDRERMREYEEAHADPQETTLPDGESVEEEEEEVEGDEVMDMVEAVEEGVEGEVAAVEEVEAVEEEVGEEAVEDEKPEHLYEVGEIIITQEQLGVLLEAKDKFEREFELKVDSLEYYPVERELHFIVAAAYPYAVKVDLINSLDEQFEKLRDVSGRLDLRNEPLEYIDLRVIGNKVFYKPLEVD